MGIKTIGTKRIKRQTSEIQNSMPAPVLQIKRWQIKLRSRQTRYKDSKFPSPQQSRFHNHANSSHALDQQRTPNQTDSAQEYLDQKPKHAIELPHLKSRTLSSRSISPRQGNQNFYVRRTKTSIFGWIRLNSGQIHEYNRMMWSTSFSGRIHPELSPNVSTITIQLLKYNIHCLFNW